jgi:hypothetical protein
MSLHTKNSGGDFELAPAGMHIARCYAIIDLGTHEDPTFGKKKHYVRIQHELPLTKMTNEKLAGKPFSISNRYTLSHNEKAILRVHLESWYGKKFNDAELDKAGGFDLTKLLGRASFINVVHSENGKYANIGSINPIPAGMECPPQINPSVMFTFENFDKRVFDSLSEKTQDYIKESDEWAKLQGGGGAPAHETAGSDFQDDGIPFITNAGIR